MYKYLIVWLMNRRCDRIELGDAPSSMNDEYKVLLKGKMEIDVLTFVGSQDWELVTVTSIKDPITLGTREKLYFRQFVSTKVSDRIRGN